MGVDKWVTALVGLLGVAAAIWINSPLRKRIVDEIAMRDVVSDPNARLELEAVIETNIGRYLVAQSQRYRRGRRILMGGAVLAVAGTAVNAFTESYEGIWFAVAGGGLLGIAVPFLRSERHRATKVRASTDLTSPRSADTRRHPSKARRH